MSMQSGKKFYSKSYGKKYKMSPTTKFLLAFQCQVVLNNGSTGTWFTNSGGATSTPNRLYGSTNATYPVNNPQLVGGFMLKSCIFRTQGSSSVITTWALALVKIENSLAPNNTSFPTVVNTITTFYAPEENVLYFDLGCATNSLTASTAITYYQDSSDTYMAIKTKRALNFGDGLSIIFGAIQSSEATNINLQGILQFFVKNCY